MTHCPICEREIPVDSRVCPYCTGRVFEDPSAATVTQSRATASSMSVASPGTLEGARFAPGAIVAERYRIVGLVGRGGMGEVYRAEDLKLRQTVALKFLPDQFGTDPARVDRFMHEVRISREVTHPNVCRVHDVSEVGGVHFLSMEYVDGDDLASVLRRMGRPSADKAAEIARQMCMGLAAAHDKGVLHRDFKPHNVMVDSQGQVRVTDFGLAGFADQVTEDIKSGTPAYMAPEQLSGRSVTERSDLYALGAVLFELYTGRRWHDALPAEERGDVTRMRQAVARAFASISDLDEVLRSIVQSCLHPDPAARPPSALAVASTLPGGDVLDYALAVGETPSPEMVAAAGGSGHLPLKFGIALLAVVVGGLGFMSFADRAVKTVPFADPELPRQVLEHRARQILERFRYEPGQDHASRFERRWSLLRFIDRYDDAPQRWDCIAGSSDVLQFWYRESPYPLVPNNRWGRVWQSDPPLTAGMTLVKLNSDGELVHFQAQPANVVPPVEDGADVIVSSFDWGPVFDEAGLEESAFSAATPEYVPQSAFDEQAAWTGPHPRLDFATIRLEAASWRGHLVWVHQSQKWKMSGREQATRAGVFTRINQYATSALLLVTLVGGVWFGGRNLLLRRGDPARALRLALFYLMASMLGWALRAHHVPKFSAEMSNFQLSLAWALWQAVLTGLLYLALEPTVRDKWPQKLISWNRLLSGWFTDPLIGREILIGISVAIVYTSGERLHYLMVGWLGAAPPIPLDSSLDLLQGTASAIAAVVLHQTEGVHMAMVALFLLVLFEVVFRKRAAALIAVFAIAILRIPYAVSDLPALDWCFRGLSAALILIVIFRSGLLALCVTMFTLTLLSANAVYLYPARWYSGSSYFLVSVLVGMTLYGLIIASRSSRRDSGHQAVPWLWAEFSSRTSPT